MVGMDRGGVPEYGSNGTFSDRMAGLAARGRFYMSTFQHAILTISTPISTIEKSIRIESNPLIHNPKEYFR